MIKYHGTPMTPKSVFMEAMVNKNVLISYAVKRNLKEAISICDNIILDNGAYTFWNRKVNVDWNKYYNWINKHYKDISYFIIPDIIDGTEIENDLLIESFELEYSKLKDKAMPVWHIAESIDRLIMLSKKYNYIAFGSSGEYKKVGTNKWHTRMKEVMNIICDKNGYPPFKIHMLRCLDIRVFVHYPFYSGDSTNVCQNYKKYNTPKEVNNGYRYLINKIESKDSPLYFNRKGEMN